MADKAAALLRIAQALEAGNDIARERLEEVRRVGAEMLGELEPTPDPGAKVADATEDEPGRFVWMPISGPASGSTAEDPARTQLFGGTAVPAEGERQAAHRDGHPCSCPDRPWCVPHQCDGSEAGRIACEWHDHVAAEKPGEIRGYLVGSKGWKKLIAAIERSEAVEQGRRDALEAVSAEITSRLAITTSDEDYQRGRAAAYQSLLIWLATAK